MALIDVLDRDAFQAVGKDHQDTDCARFFYNEDKRIGFIMTRSPEVMRIPKNQQPGSIRINKHKTVPLNSDNTFYYGAWPQKKVSAEISKKLDEEAKQTIYYYKIKGNTYYEYELNDQRYVFIHGQDKWFEVQFIKWVYDPQTKRAYTEKALWNIEEADEKSLKYFWLQAFQSTSKMREAEKRKSSNLEQRLSNGMKDKNFSYPVPER